MSGWQFGDVVRVIPVDAQYYRRAVFLREDESGNCIVLYATHESYERNDKEEGYHVPGLRTDTLHPSRVMRDRRKSQHSPHVELEQAIKAFVNQIAFSTVRTLLEKQSSTTVVSDDLAGLQDLISSFVKHVVSSTVQTMAAKQSAATVDQSDLVDSNGRYLK